MALSIHLATSLVYFEVLAVKNTFEEHLHFLLQDHPEGNFTAHLYLF